MLGGYQIIDLRKIGLELKGTQQTISDAGILKQLRGLRDYIEKSHDYTNPLNNSLKPILIRYRDQKNNEKREVTSFASIINTNNSLTFTVESKHLQIEVVFEEKTDDDGNKYYDIKTAKYYYNENESIEGKLTVGGDLSVGGDLDIEGDIEGEGKITADEIIENMEGYSFTLGHIDNLTTTGVYAGVVKTGNKITFAVAVKFRRTDTMLNAGRLGLFTIPKSVFDRLYQAQIGLYDYLTVDEKPAWSSDSQNKAIQVYSYKSGGGDTNVVIDMNLDPLNELTINTDYYFRYEFTLLLSDNLIPNE